MNNVSHQERSSKLRRKAQCFLYGGGLCLLIGMGLFSGTALAAAPHQSPPLEYLAQWVGKYPFDKIDGVSLWDQPALQAPLLKTLGKSRFKALQTSRQVTEPVQRQGDILALWVCRPHFCSMTDTKIFVNLKSEDVQACWTEPLSLDMKAGETMWLKSGQPPKTLPFGTCAAGDSPDGFRLLNLYGGV